MSLIRKVSALVCMFAFSCSCQYPNLKKNGFQPTDSFNSTVKIGLLVSTPDGDGMSSGTGWAIDSDHLITAAHVCASFIELELLGMGKGYVVDYVESGKILSKEANLEIIDFDTDNDVCLIRYKNHGLIPLKLADDFFFGEKVYVIGAPMGFLGFIFDGFIANVDIDLAKELKNKILVSAAATGGNSGGPVVNEQGEVIGILIAGVSDFDHFSICTSVKMIKKFLEDIKFKTK